MKVEGGDEEVLVNDVGSGENRGVERDGDGRVGMEGVLGGKEWGEEKMG